ncbi:MAG: type 4a pilus biogenesis protein PilO [Acidobacteria bacterium]|nr:type 4a pilus biogenesis protein PilO [Acidobacteriota bacterium]
MALPKFNDLSPAAQIAVVLVVGAGLWGVSEYLLLKPLRDQNNTTEQQVQQLTKDVEPLRPYRERLSALETENRQLEAQLQNLQQIVPTEKEVEGLIRQVQSEAGLAGVVVRRFTSKPLVQQPLYVEVPFEVELDGAFYDVLQFFDRIGRLERIINVSGLKMAGLDSKRSIGQKQYPYNPAESVVAVCTVTTFFSREEAPPPAPAARGRGRAPARGRQAPAPAPAR